MFIWVLACIADIIRFPSALLDPHIGIALEDAFDNISAHGDSNITCI